MINLLLTLADTGLHLQGMCHLLVLWFVFILRNLVLKSAISAFKFSSPCWLMRPQILFKLILCLLLQVMFYEALKDLTECGKQKWMPGSDYFINSSTEGLVLGGLAGGMCCSA